MMRKGTRRFVTFATVDVSRVFISLAHYPASNSQMRPAGGAFPGLRKPHRAGIPPSSHHGNETSDHSIDAGMVAMMIMRLRQARLAGKACPGRPDRLELRLLLIA